MKFPAAITLLIPLVFVLTMTACAQQQKPEALANRFYRNYLELNVRGLPDAKELKMLSPYLSEDLRQLFEKAQLEQKQFIEKHAADMKPPWVDGDMFTSLFEGAQSFEVGAVKMRGDYADVSVSLKYKEGDSTTRWNDTLVLIKTKEGWRVWDILLNGDWQFKSGSSLRKVLGAK